MDFILSYNNNEGVMTFPVIPNGGISLSRGQANQTFEGVTGQLQSIGTMELATFELSSIFPNRRYRWMRPGSTENGWSYVETIEAVRKRRIPFRAIYTDNNRRTVFNLPVTVENFEYSLDQAGDIAYTISFREYAFATMPAALLGSPASASGSQTAQTDSQAAASSGSGGGGTFAKQYTATDATMMAKVMFCESRGIKSKTEIACIGWTILNRVDAGYGSIYKVITAPNQFAYRSNASTTSDYGYDLVALATDVLDRWSREKAGQTSVGRVLPKGYLWYAGDGRHNYFRNQYKNGTRWNYSLPSPYES